jgi:hypothetical protein
MRVSIKVISGLYAAIGAANAVFWLYAVLFRGVLGSTPGFLDGVIPLATAYGLISFRPWGRSLCLAVAAFEVFAGVLGLVMCLGHVAGIHRADGGMILDRPILTFGILAILLAFAAWQWWLLTRPPVREMFRTNAA